MKEQGFTLLEVLVALIISSILVVAAAAFLRSNMTLQQRVNRVTTRLGKRAAVVYLLFKQLQNIPPEAPGTREVFQGESDTMRFISWIPATGRFFPGIFGVEYKVEDGNLYERDLPLMDKDDVRDFVRKKIPEDKLKWHLLIKGVKGFSYASRGRWVDRWIRLGLPDAVKIEGENGITIPVFNTKRY